MQCNNLCPFFNNGYCKLAPRITIPFGSPCINEDLRIVKIREIAGIEEFNGKIRGSARSYDKCDHKLSTNGKCDRCGIMVNKA